MYINYGENRHPVPVPDCNVKVMVYMIRVLLHISGKANLLCTLYSFHSAVELRKNVYIL